ncbi:HNH endonuclease signature motif containing protein [Paramicrobacterium fandaimingii]|uniref:HNH endonuclease signature motif containing protein n=1 Tax=Paramicrobacterium fandaimingii TaxID=2708079 RepID=UPI001420BA79|nr:HNH endonuclease signature motif containing protein [Microbacterium fandaimingii]
MNSRELCSMLGRPLPMSDENARLADRYWMIRDMVELDDECESPVAGYEDMLGADFDELGLAYESAQRAQANVIDSLQRAHDNYRRSRDAIVAHSTSSTPSARISDDEAMERSFISEAAARMGITDRAAEAMVHEAETLVNDLPQTMDALRLGFTSYLHARTAAQQAWSVPPKARAEFDEQIVGMARTQSPTRFKQSARKLREKLHPESIQKRKTTAFEDRHVEVVPDEDGMAWMNVYHSADVALSIKSEARAHALRVRKAGDGRTLQQIEADSVVETVAAGLAGHRASASATAATTAEEESGGSSTGAEMGASTETGADFEAVTDGDEGTGCDESTEGDVGTGVARDSGTDTVTLTRAQLAALRPGVVVTVPILSLLGQSSEPADLAGYGPIDPETAANIIGSATSFTRVLTDPITGAQRIVDPDKYRLSEQLKRDIRLRDATCGFVNCDAPAWRCDIDHIVAWDDGGKSTPANLNSLCRRHHVLKHATNWQVSRLSDGALEWISPSGSRYVVRRE